MPYGRRNHQLLLTGSAGGNIPTVHKLVDDSWQLTFTFGVDQFYQNATSVEAAQRGSVIFASRGNSELWEVRDSDWRHFTSPYAASFFTADVFDVTRGDM